MIFICSSPGVTISLLIHFHFQYHFPYIAIAFLVSILYRNPPLVS